MKAGEKLEDGSFEEDSVKDRVQKSLDSLANKMKNLGQETESGDKNGEKNQENNERN